ncbi:uncharacterized protein [Musca autumnalis]|uniref:uncharacterized protein n=1 Tax=Musca autumnalis TaxID=221902 RepID=UPI003CE8A4D3
MRTIFDALRKPSTSALERNEKMENQYNAKHGTKPKSFKPGDLVYAKEFRHNKSEWVPGEIINKTGTVTYDTAIWVGSRKKLIKAHADQLRTRLADEVPPSLDNALPLDILLQDFNIQLPPTDHTASQQSSEDFITPPSSPIINYQPRRITQRRQPVEVISRSPVQT